jgi:aminoglycoside N3'-acetyltransferase
MTDAATRTTLAEQLRSLGVRAGVPVMVHSSLRKVGPIVGGAEALLDALVDATSPAGTLMMVLGADLSVPFDAKITPVDVQEMGVFAEVFRQHPEVRVNDHAAARYGALGLASRALLEPTPLHDYHGPGSVLERFTKAGGTVLRLGANVETVTLTHWAEYRARLPDKRRVKLRYVRADIGEQWIDSLDDTDGIRDWPQGDYFPQIWLDFLAAGHARTGPVGRTIGELFDAQRFVCFATAWMESNLGPQRDGS